jgi:hypothetical protein
MGEMADLVLDQMFDDEYDEEWDEFHESSFSPVERRPRVLRCKYCKTVMSGWQQFDGKWRLTIDWKTPHTCKEFGGFYR